MKKVLVLGCSNTLHHATTNEPIPGIREPAGDYPFFLSQLFPDVNWYNFGKGASSNFEYIRRISTFIESFGRPDFVLIQITYAERMLLEFHNYQKISVTATALEKDNYFVVVEENIRQNGAYISGYNLYCTMFPEQTLKSLRDVTALHLTSTFHAWRFWETYFLIQTYLKSLNLPHLLFISHLPTRYPIPPVDKIPIDFSTTLGHGKTTLHGWIEQFYGPYEDCLIGDGDYHLKMKYNEAVAKHFLYPELKSLLSSL